VGQGARGACGAGEGIDVRITYDKQPIGVAFAAGLVVRECPVCGLGCVRRSGEFVHEHRIVEDVRVAWIGPSQEWNALSRPRRNRAVVVRSCRGVREYMLCQ